MSGFSPSELRKETEVTETEFGLPKTEPTQEQVINAMLVSKLQELQGKKQKNLQLAKSGAFLLASAAIKCLILFLAWNLVLPNFGVPSINYFEAVAIFALTRFIKLSNSGQFF